MSGLAQPAPGLGALSVTTTSGDCIEPRAFGPGRSVHLEGAGFAPGQDVLIRAFFPEGNERVLLTTSISDQVGNLNETIHLPADLSAPATAVLEALGDKEDGAPLLLFRRVLVDGTVGNDSDGDGVADECDNCRDDSNNLQEDADTDGIGDACDVCPDDPDNDADADGVCGEIDSCPFDAENDSDDDGFCASEDNCPFVANPDQSDSDTDGRGDACADVPCHEIEITVVPNDAGGVALSAPNCGNAAFENGTSVQIEVEAAPGYSFDGWLLDATGDAAPLVVTVSRNLRIIANFVSAPAETVTATVSPTPVNTSTASTTMTPVSDTPTPQPTTPTAALCPCDCDGDQTTMINELVTSVRIALGQSPVQQCVAADVDGGGRVEISELVRGVIAALGGC